jgi:hypothetical protein
MKLIGIYKIKSIIHPEHIYVGSAVNIKRRWTVHLRDLKNNRHHSSKLQHHYNKYGVNDLTFSIIEECLFELLLVKEQHYLNLFNPYFNICKIAGNCIGRIPWNKNKIMSKEFSEKMKIASTGNKNRLGHKHSPETKMKIRNKLKDRGKLSLIEINEIKFKYIPRKYTANMLASEYNVCKDTILNAIHN